MQVAIGQWRRYAARNLAKCNTLATFGFEILYLGVSRLRTKRMVELANLRWKGFLSNSIKSDSHKQASEGHHAA
jgi:hypothetical protein